MMSIRKEQLPKMRVISGKITKFEDIKVYSNSSSEFKDELSLINNNIIASI